MSFSYAYLLLLAVVLVCSPMVSARVGQKPKKLQSPPNNKDVIPQNYMVEFTSSVTDVKAKARSIAAEFPDIKVEKTLKGMINGVVVSGCNLTVLDWLESNNDVKAIAPNAHISKFNIFQRIQSNASWGLARIVNGGTEYRYDETGGTDVIVYILDTGVIDFTAEYDNRYNATGCMDFTSEKNCTKPDDHGTFVAGIVGSKTFGVAKNVTIENFKVLETSGSGSWDSVVNALNEVVARVEKYPHKKHIISMSFGGGKYDYINNIIRDVVAKGVVAVAAAGNSNDDACLYSPASEPTVITVASTNFWDERSWFSNYGSCVDVFAPGESVQSWDRNGIDSTWSGTSFAAPYVSGVAALYLSKGKTTEEMLQNAELNMVKNPGYLTTNLFINAESLLAVSPRPTATPTSLATLAAPTRPPTRSPTSTPTRAPTRPPTTRPPTTCKAIGISCRTTAECCSGTCTRKVCKL